MYVPSEVKRDSDEVVVEDHVETLEDRTPITRITVAEHYRVEPLRGEAHQTRWKDGAMKLTRDESRVLGEKMLHDSSNPREFLI